MGREMIDTEVRDVKHSSNKTPHPVEKISQK